jgi:hypothetical protein
MRELPSLTLTNLRVKHLNTENKKLIKSIDTNKTPMYINGSFFQTLWASDIDLFQNVSKENIKHLISFLYDSLKNVGPNIKMMELKIGKTKHKDINVLKDYKAVMKQLEDGGFIKIDFLVYSGSYIEDITIIYNVAGDFKLDVPKVQKDTFKEIKANNHYKAIKRIHLLLPDDEKLNGILNNGDLGYAYITLSRIKALQEGLKSFSSKQIEDTIAQLNQDLFYKIGNYYPTFRNNKKLSRRNLKSFISRLKTAMKKQINTLRTK